MHNGSCINLVPIDFCTMVHISTWPIIHASICGAAAGRSPVSVSKSSKICPPKSDVDICVHIQSGHSCELVFQRLCNITRVISLWGLQRTYIWENFLHHPFILVFGKFGFVEKSCDLWSNTVHRSVIVNSQLLRQKQVMQRKIQLCSITSMNLLLKWPFLLFH